MPELEQDVKEFFESGGEKAPVDEVNAEVKESPKESPKEVVKEPVKDTAKEAVKEAPKEDDDPHAENHRKALKEAREELKKFKREQKEREEMSTKELAEMREKFRLWNDAVQKQNQPQAPKFEDDPANHLKFQQDQQQKELEELRGFRAQQTQAFQQQQAIQKFSQDLNTYESQFTQEAPDYPNAAQYIGNLWKAELELSGVQQGQIDQAYLFRVAQFANAAIRRGDNPAEVVYELAKRAGYKKQESATSGAEQKLESIHKGQEASKSLGGGKPDVDFSLDALKEMSPLEIDAFVANPKNWAKLARA